MSEHQPLANLDFWDTVNHFTLIQIAWLWCGLEPPVENDDDDGDDGDGDGDEENEGPDAPILGQRIRLKLFRMMQNHCFPLYKGFMLHRVDLREWAKNHTYKPMFLFPELRPPAKQTGLSMDVALQVVAALAKAMDPRWNPGQPAPHGMVKKLTEVAGILGLRLDRNTIGKYLKEAGNKNISA